MPRFTDRGWWCGACKSGVHIPPEVRICPKCGHSRFERHAQVHASERAVVYYNPVTGEHRTPARADMPMPEQYVQQGYERQEIMNMGKWEKDAGVIHEATNFNPGNEMPPMDPFDFKPKPEVVHDLAKDLADALTSSPWTGHEKLM